MKYPRAMKMSPKLFQDKVSRDKRPGKHLKLLRQYKHECPGSVSDNTFAHCWVVRVKNMKTD